MEKKVSISEAAKQLSLETHALRYWEVELGLHISRNSQGHRFYRARDIELLRDIKDLKEQGFQLKAIKRILPDIKNVKNMPPMKLYELREELNQQVQMEESSSRPGSHTAQVMPLHPGQLQEQSSYPYSQNQSYSQGAEEKLRHFEAMMRKMIRSTVEEMQAESEEHICEKITTRILKEIDYLNRQREELHEQQVVLLKQILSEVRHELPEAAASEEPQTLITGKKTRERGKGRKKKMFAKQK